ncbi:unnamed protein product [Kuraishia capsulata CBS 1993]|uniref:C3H1-type domain-containing protein n=1 Tax=Kuraishia capsulata CBS 1993 TaxID=1382522 RepID=W6MTY3_9ASCO|nr:uncharacterized protein KUCA_T00005973001 [Kuraishia capsulata CBS 1993]CDK29978.1 unnamed protein product [Kuraishia capsulata CBS 1993]
MWNNPKFLQRLEESGPNSNSNNDTKEEVAYVETPEDKENFDLVFKDVFLECSLKHGIVEDMVVCENTNPHLSGNVYIKFRDLDSAIAAQADFQDRYFDSRPVFAEFCGVRSFEDAICKMFRSNECDRGGLCNFMHVKQPSQGLLQELLKSQAKWSAERGAQRQRV